MRKEFLPPGLYRILLLCSALGSLPLSSGAAPLPNILWLVAEDINPHLGCYGDAQATTPNIDRLAARGLRYTKCWSTAPVCAPARTTLISGVYPTSMGAEHMRSEVAVPGFLRTYPQLLRQAGYYCVNKNKTDYNIQPRGKVWDESSPRAHYRNRQSSQPFFAAFNIELSHESQIRTRPHKLSHDPIKIPLPAYHPDTPEVRHDWAQYYDQITEMDKVVGKYLEELANLGLAEDTIVFFYGDNGSGMPRSKRWPYNSGLNVPLVVHVPERFKALAPQDYRPGAASDRLVGFIDFAPTLLSLAGTKPPEWMQGRAFMGRYDTPEARYSFGFRGRMDERYDLVRSVRNQRYIYIRNYMPHLIYGQYLDYMFQTPTTRVWKKLYDEGKLTAPRTFFWESKPPEELYDLETDPDEVKNLAVSPGASKILEELKAVLRAHTLETRDAGFLPEPELHTRAKNTSIYEMARDNALYPLERILATAELASGPGTEDAGALKNALADGDSAVRYWAALGIFIRGADAVKRSSGLLRGALKDTSPIVRIAAAEALATHGGAGDRADALPVLRELASPAQNGAYVSLLALNAIDRLGPVAAPVLGGLDKMPMSDPASPARANGYVERLVQHILVNR
jgi:arylsulfatase A-like enzyme